MSANPFKMKAVNSGGDYELPPAGTQLACLVALVDLGTQRTEYANEVKWVRKVYMVWELPGEKMSGMKDKNHLIARDFTLTFSPKSLLRGVVEKWTGKSFAEGHEIDLTRLLDPKFRACLLAIAHKTSGSGKTYAKVESVMAVPKGTQVPSCQHEPFCWSVGSSLEEIPSWIPYLYGESVGTVIERCQEISGQGEDAGDGKEGSAAAEPEAATVSGGDNSDPF